MAFSQPNFNQAEMIRAGMSLVPDLAGQMMQDRLLKLQEQEVGLRQQQEGRLLAEASRKQQREDAFRREIEEVGANPTPERIVGLMSRYPEFSEGLKRAWDAGSEEKRGRDMGQLGEVFSYLKSGNVERAKTILKRRVEAERAAGLQPDEEGLLALLEGGDPESVAQVQAQVGMALAAAAGPDKFASVYGGLNPDQTEFEKQHAFIEREYGREAADTFARNKYDEIVVGQPGAPVYRSSQFDKASGGQQGDSPAPQKSPKAAPVADAGSVVRQMFPGANVTQVRRDPNSALGKANPKSWHNHSGAAVDVAPIPGMTFGQYIKRFKDAGYTILEAKNEVGKGRSKHATGDHWHVVLGGGPNAPQRVYTRQQFEKLPSGTLFIAPDGSTRRKP